METNLARLAETALERLGDRPSLFFEGAWYSSGQLHERAARVATGLIARGVRPGDRIVVMMTNCAEVTVVYSAAWRAGAVVTPVIFLLSAPELKHVLEDSGAVLVVTTPELVPKLKEALDGRPLPVLVVGENFGEVEAHEPSAVVDRAPDDLAALLYTGGTTGRSKGVALTHANLSNAGASSRKVSHVPGIVRGIGALPLSHSFGLLVTVGGYHTPEPTSSVLQRWFDPGSFLALAAEHRCQTAPVVPSMLVMLLGFPLEEYDLSELRFIYSGAAPLAPSVAEEFERRVPGVRVLEGYGCTETAGILTGSPPLNPRRGTVGQPVPERRDQDRRSGRRGGARRRGWGDHRPGPERDGRLLALGRCAGRRLVPHRRRRAPRRRRLPDDRGPDEGSDHPQRVQRVPPRRRGRPPGASGRLDGRRRRPGRPPGGRGGGRVRLPQCRGRADGGGPVAYAKERIAANKYPREVHIVDAIPLTSVGKLDRKRLRATIREAAPENVA